MPGTLFRRQALDNLQDRWLGNVLMARPISFTVVAIVSGILLIAIVAFLVLSSYTKRVAVVGELVPEGGLIRVYSPQGGVVVERKIADGEAVRTGDVMFVVSTERYSGSGSGVQESVGRMLAESRETVIQEMADLSALEQIEHEAISRSASVLEEEIARYDELLEIDRRRVALAERQKVLSAEMAAQGFISTRDMETVEDQYLMLLSARARLDRERLETFRHLEELRARLMQLPVDYRMKRTNLERMLLAIAQQSEEGELKRLVSITAPADGVTTAVQIDVGQVIESSRPLASILAVDSKLQAHLYAPTASVGFVDVGDAVMLRYTAFPYQKFGHFAGTIVEVSRATITADEIASSTISSLLGSTDRQPLYRIKVDLPAQYIAIGDLEQPLQVGMLVEGDILQERRRLYEWALEPLFGLKEML